MSTYTLFLDESGQIDYPKFDPQRPILSVGGVAIMDDDHAAAKRALLRFKADHLKSNHSTLRYADITGARRQFESLRDPVLLRTFLSDLYTKTLAAVEWKAFVGAIDKPRYLRMYGTRPIDRYLPQDPHLVAFAFVIERFVTFLEQNNSDGRIIYEARDPWRNAYVQWEYVMMHVNGTQYLRNAQFNRRLPCWIEFIPKAEANVGLEMADLVVGPTTRRVGRPLEEMLEWNLLAGRFWKGTSPSAPGQLGFKVFPGDLGRELLRSPRSSS